MSIQLLDLGPSAAGQEKSPPIRVVPDSLWNTRQTGHQSRLEGVLKKKGGVEVANLTYKSEERPQTG